MHQDVNAQEKKNVTMASIHQALNTYVATYSLRGIQEGAMQMAISANTSSQDKGRKRGGVMILTVDGANTISFICEGIPVAKARPRATRSGVVYTPRTTMIAERNIREAYLERVNRRPKPTEKPVAVAITFYFPQPKNTSKKKLELNKGKPRAKKPDVDNLIKTVLDALNGVAWLDDNQVVAVYAQKLNGCTRGFTEVHIEEVNDA